MSKWTTEFRRQYAREYYRKHKQEILAKAVAYRNRPEVQARVVEYKSQPEVKARCRNLIAAKRSDINYVLHERRAKRKFSALRKQMIDSIQLHYGCMNPNCPWEAKLLPCQMDFHHIDKSAKSGQVSMMRTYDLKRIAAEINKCVVLCRNCHASVESGDLILDSSLKCNVNDDLVVVN